MMLFSFLGTKAESLCVKTDFTVRSVYSPSETTVISSACGKDLCFPINEATGEKENDEDQQENEDEGENLGEGKKQEAGAFSFFCKHAHTHLYHTPAANNNSSACISSAFNSPSPSTLCGIFILIRQIRI